MKKLFTIVALLAFVSLASAQQDLWPRAKSFKFLNVPAVYATNTLQITNLATTSSLGTNKSGTVWTNKAGIRVTSTTTANLYDNLLSDVPLWALGDGSPAAFVGATNASVAVPFGYATFSTTMTAASGANAAVTFVVTPVVNGVNESTESTDQWTFSFTPTASSTQTFTTNAPLHRWPGAAKLRLRRIVNGDTDVTSIVIITDVSLNGFGPP